MFDQIKTIPNVFRYFTAGHDLYVITPGKQNREVVRYALNNLEIINRASTSAHQILFVGNDLLLIDSANHAEIMDRSLHSKFTFPDEVRMATNQRVVDHVTIYKGSISARTFGVFSLALKKELWMQQDVKPIQLYGDIVIGETPDTICRLNILDGTKKWEFNLAEIGGDQHDNVSYLIKGIANDLLFISADAINKLFALDLATGKMIWQISTISEFISWDERQNRFLLLTENFVSYDALTGARIETADQLNLGVISQRGDNIVDGDTLITTDYRKGKVAAFDLKDHKLKWIYEITDSSFPPSNALTFASPYLFAHDMNGMLHVFHKN